MTEAFDPKTCDSDQWKTWLRQGARLYLRALSGWGLLWVVVYLALGWAIHQHVFCLVIAVGLSGIFQMAHLGVAARVAQGRVGLMDSLGVLWVLFRDHRKLCLETIAVRTLMCALALGVMFMADGVILLAQHLLGQAAAPVAVHQAVTGWNLVMAAGSAIFDGAIFPIIMQLGGSVSCVLMLRQEGIDLQRCRQLDALGTQRNRKSMFVLSWVFIFGAFVCIMIPITLPFWVVYWMSVMHCVYADVFKQGTKIEAMARAPVKASVRPAAAFSASMQ
jgi:hypothetical protein